jgi:hypothetical protein
MSRWVGLCFGWLLAVGAFAQRQGSPFALPPLAPIPPLSGGRPGVFHLPGSGGRSRGFSRFPRSFAAGYPGWYGDYGYDPQPNVVIVQPPAPALVQPPAPEPPPPPVRSEIREYPSAAPSEEKEATFAIVLKDGTVQSAAAVWVVGDMVHYIDPEGGTHKAPVDTINRAETLRLNKEKGLRLQLP